MKKIYVKDLSDGDQIEDIFLVKRKGKGVSKSNKPYLILTVQDSSGEIEGRVWDRANELGSLFNTGDFIFIKARTNIYQGKIQLNVVDIEKVDSVSVNAFDYLPSSERNPDELLVELKKIYKKIQDVNIKKLISSFLEDKVFIVDLKKAPAATSVHHAYIGGLLEHIHSLSNLALKVCSHYKDLNQDLILAGVFLHDIGKVKEISTRNAFEYTDEGKLLGHLVIGCQMVEERADKIKNFPKETKLMLNHLIVSHHGSLEFGSPKLPQTLEALVLHFLDNLDAKYNMVTKLINESENTWTDYSKFMGRGFYKSEVEPETDKSETKKKTKSKQSELELFK